MTATPQQLIAQLVERPTEKPGAILTRVRVRGAARDFSPRVSFKCRLSYGVSTAPVCNGIHQHLCARYKSRTLTAIPLFGHTKILHTLIGMGRILHTLIGMGSAALVAVVPYPGKETRISSKGQINTNKFVLTCGVFCIARLK